MAVRLGINPITWSNDDVPELGGDISLETILSETREAGFLGMGHDNLLVLARDAGFAVTERS